MHAAARVGCRPAAGLGGLSLRPPARAGCGRSSTCGCFALLARTFSYCGMPSPLNQRTSPGRVTPGAPTCTLCPSRCSICAGGWGEGRGGRREEEEDGRRAAGGEKARRGGRAHAAALHSAGRASRRRSSRHARPPRSRSPAQQCCIGTAAVQQRYGRASRWKPTSASSRLMVRLHSRPSPRRSKSGCRSVRSTMCRSPCSPAGGGGGRRERGRRGAAGDKGRRVEGRPGSRGSPGRQPASNQLAGSPSEPDEQDLSFAGGERCSLLLTSIQQPAAHRPRWAPPPRRR